MAQVINSKFSILKYHLKILQKLPKYHQTHSFPAIDSSFDLTSTNALNDKERNIEIVQNAIQLRERIILKGKMVPKREKGPTKLSTYERMSLLIDKDCTPLLLSVTAGEDLSHGSINSAGILVAVVKVMGKYCIVNANDWASKGGTLYPISLKKQLRAQEISKMNRLPSLYIVDSGGAFLPLQVRYVHYYYLSGTTPL